MRDGCLREASSTPANARARSSVGVRVRSQREDTGHRTRLAGWLLVFPAGLEDRGWLSAFCHIQSTLTIRALARACACACLQPSSKPHLQFPSLPLLPSCTKQREASAAPPSPPPPCCSVPPQLAPAAPPARSLLSFAPVPADAPSPLHSTPGPCCCTLDRRRARRSLTTPHHTHDQRSSRRLSTTLAARSDIFALASHPPHLATRAA
jgi:hypothetical protein